MTAHGSDGMRAKCLRRFKGLEIWRFSDLPAKLTILLPAIFY
jgi:hypothetical protein